ncbi:hypothetical protein A3C23_00555 [Candidatus Roizmanbacteria bacterium RIFCSPHIGHO2_02_FULL_37_13b]|uniref:MIP18 family-like domain-containing protein n=1 Tax=Candidatus Roizmanbacteria bacterium RIFCSPLOWO2_02_FULL_36_11 TaxID=1802071 RepID=A0A1F7JD02_9BACT|nr:MAG: hypothetical protein A3C23_00555 [Candidatus Roizmanbacteria bacterium RIFCSPHIGHO2_02_FULL_37_13b]OGK53490.1 MAG: hypothetical protein A3H78_04665 [Candidatus Roizmanbacteria bacterium RIFCSPLOWO2_02_FULL_36_11]
MKRKRSKLENKLFKKLEEVIDPELRISIVDLGLVYSVTEKDGLVDIVMTLTTMGCPLYEVIDLEIKEKLKTIAQVKKVEVNLVFDPPWSIDLMTPQGKAMLGI